MGHELFFSDKFSNRDRASVALMLTLYNLDLLMLREPMIIGTMFYLGQSIHRKMLQRRFSGVGFFMGRVFMPFVLTTMGFSAHVASWQFAAFLVFRNCTV